MFFGNLRMMVACLINIREVLSESVKSKWKNLADAIDICLVILRSQWVVH